MKLYLVTLRYENQNTGDDATVQTIMNLPADLPWPIDVIRMNLHWMYRFLAPGCGIRVLTAIPFDPQRFGVM